MSSGATENGSKGSYSDGFRVLFSHPAMVAIHKPADVAMDEPECTPAEDQSEAVTSLPPTNYSLPRSTVSSWAYSYMKTHGIYDAMHDALERKNQRRKQLKFVHQLDYGTSGVLCLAFTKLMAQRLAHCFEMRTTRKWYIALLDGDTPNRLPLLHQDAERLFASGSTLASSGKDCSNGCDAVPSFSRLEDGSTVNGARKKMWRAEDAKNHSEEEFGDGDGEHPAGARQRVIELSSRERREEMKHAFRLEFFDENRKMYLRPRQLFRCVEGTDTSSKGGEPATGVRLCCSCKQDSYNGATDPLTDDVEGGAGRCCALCEVEAAFEEHTLVDISLPIGKDGDDEKGFRMCVGGENPREGVTSLLVLGHGLLRPHSSASPYPVTKVLLMPRTGRRHQLRLHTWALGQPILGDVTYGALPPPSWGGLLRGDGLPEGQIRCRSETSSAPHTGEEGGPHASPHLWPRMYLHAWRLAVPFCFPAGQEQVKAEENSRGVRDHKCPTSAPSPDLSDRKRMRRERLGMEDAVGNAIQRGEWSDVITTDPFVLGP